MPKSKAQPEAEAEETPQPGSERIPDYHGKIVVLRKQRRVLVGEQGRGGQWAYITEMEGQEGSRRETSGVWYNAEQFDSIETE